MVKHNLPALQDMEGNQEDQMAFNTRIQTQVDTMDARMIGMDVKLKLLCKTVEEMSRIMKGKDHVGASSSHDPEIQELDPSHEIIIPRNPVETGINNLPRPLSANLVKNIPVEFPKFNEDDPRGWVKKCQRFF